MKFLLVLNTGSSSVKFRLFKLQKNLPLIAGGKVTDIGGGNPSFKASIEGGQETFENLSSELTHETALSYILSWLDSKNIGNIDSAVHRIVHGGEKYSSPILLNKTSMHYLRSLVPLAPLHQPHNLAGIDILEKKMPNLRQYACFDTAFHACHDELHYSFALSDEMRSAGIRRYGFHGISYDWIVHSLKKDFPQLADARIVTAHLGNGASLCAIKNGKSIDTTMGMTALDGLPMGTRCGSVDAGAVIYMMRELKFELNEVERILYEESGLKGLSGITNDVKALSESDNPRALFALNYFCLKTAQNIAAMSVSIGGLDALIFTGGIGENAPGIRKAVLDYLAFLAPFEHYVIAANEERSMALDIFETFGKDILE